MYHYTSTKASHTCPLGVNREKKTKKARTVEEKATLLRHELKFLHQMLLAVAFTWWLEPDIDPCKRIPVPCYLGL